MAYYDWLNAQPRFTQKHSNDTSVICAREPIAKKCKVIGFNSDTNEYKLLDEDGNEFTFHAAYVFNYNTTS